MARTSIFKIVASVIFLLSPAANAAEQTSMRHFKEPLKPYTDTIIVDASKNRGSGICILRDKLCLTTFEFLTQDIITQIPILESCDTHKIELMATNCNTTLAAVIVSGFIKNSLQKRCLVAYKATGACTINDKFYLNADKDTKYLFEQRCPDQIILYKLQDVYCDEIVFPASESTINIKSKKETCLIPLTILKFSS
jgi:hypothetical protein